MPNNQQETHNIQAWSLINRKYLGQGVRVKRFRRPKRSQIRNRVLLAVLMAKDIKLSRLAEELGISSRSVSAWVYEGRIPSNNNIDKTCRLLGYPPHILFNEALIRQSPIVCQPTPSRFMKKKYYQFTAQQCYPDRTLYGLRFLSNGCKYLDRRPSRNVSEMAPQQPSADPCSAGKSRSFLRIPRHILFADCGTL